MRPQGMDEFEMREAERTGADRIAADNAEIGAAALRRVDALEDAIRTMLTAPDAMSKLDARVAAAQLLKAEWMPERVLAGVA